MMCHVSGMIWRSIVQVRLPLRAIWVVLQRVNLTLCVCSIIMTCSFIFRNQCTPLLLAATSGALDTIQYLFSLGANWRKTDIKGNNIIHLSVLTFHTEVLKYIIELNIPELPVWKTLVGEYRTHNLFINK